MRVPSSWPEFYQDMINGPRLVALRCGAIPSQSRDWESCLTPETRLSHTTLWKDFLFCSSCIPAPSRCYATMPPLAWAHPHPKQNVVNWWRKDTPRCTKISTPAHSWTIFNYLIEIKGTNDWPRPRFLHCKGVVKITPSSRPITLVSSFDKSGFYS